MSKEKVIVIGAGIVGSQMAVDLCHEFDVTAADKNAASLNRLVEFPLKIEQADLQDPVRINELIKSARLVLLAMPSHLSHEILGLIIRAGKDVVDISFSGQDPFIYDTLALEKKVTAIVDCGIAPGMGNIIAGHHLTEMRVETLNYQCGGLPVVPHPVIKHNYQFGGSMDLYVRSPRHVRDGQIVTEEPLSGLEAVQVNGLTFEAVNTDGLRTLLNLKDILPNQIEKSLRHPGHVEVMRQLKRLGLLDETPIWKGRRSILPLEATNIILNRNRVNLRAADFPAARELLGSLGFWDTQPIAVETPLDLTINRLEDKWKPDPAAPSMTVMRVIIDGVNPQGQERKVEYSLLHQSIPGSGKNSLSETTGYVATMVARLIIGGGFDRPGICPPEYVGMETDALDFVIDGLKQRGIVYQKKEFAFSG